MEQIDVRLTAPTVGENIDGALAVAKEAIAVGSKGSITVTDAEGTPAITMVTLPSPVLVEIIQRLVALEAVTTLHLDDLTLHLKGADRDLHN